MTSQSPDSTARETDSRQVNNYDSFAAAYSAENDDSLANAYYERPAMLNLLGNIADRQILDIGCGSGSLTAEMLERGATVTGIDTSIAMVELAKHRLCEKACVIQSDLTNPLPFGDATFDDAVASLVLHYLEKWDPALREVRRVLRTGGRFFVSVDHPIVGYTIKEPRPNYFSNTSYEFEWEFGGQRVPMRFWRKALQTMLDAFTSAGFSVTSITEPQPLPEARELYPDGFDHFSSSPGFLFFALEASPSHAR